MSKYGLLPTWSVKSTSDNVVIYLCNIANELHEANRLKRLELKDKWTTVDPTEGSIIRHEKELEDNAW